MRKTLFTACLLIATTTQAQVLYINNTDGSYQTIDTRLNKEIIFDEEQQLVKIGMNDGTTSQFATSKVTNIAPASNNGTELIYDLAPTVSFDTSDKENFNENITEIPSDELDTNYGDFIENYAVTRTITISFSETGVKTSTLPSDVTATINGGHIIINSERSKVAYRITGHCSNGSLKIYSTKKFQIMLQNISLTNPVGPAINIQSGKTVYVTLLNGTTNTLCDGSVYNAPTIAADGTEEDQKGTFFSEGQLIFDGYTSGTGTLNIESLGGHAICSDDYIIVRGGNINIIGSAKDGFRTKKKFTIGRSEAASPTISINASGNGIECTEGPLTIEAGKLDITSGSDGIKVVYDELTPDPAIISDANITGGFIKINTTGEKSSAIQTTGSYTQTGGKIQAIVEGNGSKIINSDKAVLFNNGKLTGIANGTIASDTTSAGGIKCNENFAITGGTISIECNGRGAKGINCDSDVTISGGETTLLVQAENYTDIADDKKSRAITANNITIAGGNVVASAHNHAFSAETQITITNGTVNAYSATSTALSHEATHTGGWLLTKDAE